MEKTFLDVIEFLLVHEIVILQKGTLGSLKELFE